MQKYLQIHVVTGLTRQVPQGKSRPLFLPSPPRTVEVQALNTLPFIMSACLIFMPLSMLATASKLAHPYSPLYVHQHHTLLSLPKEGLDVLHGLPLLIPPSEMRRFSHEVDVDGVLAAGLSLTITILQSRGKTHAVITTTTTTTTALA